MKVYSLFDRKLREYGGLVLCPNDDGVRRALHEGVTPNSTVGKYPEDYDLMYLGEFDPQSGVIKPDLIALVDNVRDILVRHVGNENGGFKHVMRAEVSDALS